MGWPSWWRQNCIGKAEWYEGNSQLSMSLTFWYPCPCVVPFHTEPGLDWVAIQMCRSDHVRLLKWGRERHCNVFLPWSLGSLALGEADHYSVDTFKNLWRGPQGINWGFPDTNINSAAMWGSHLVSGTASASQAWEPHPQARTPQLSHSQRPGPKKLCDNI